MSKEECDRLEKEEEEQEEEEARQRRRNVLEDLQHNFDQVCHSQTFTMFHFVYYQTFQ